MNAREAGKHADPFRDSITIFFNTEVATDSGSEPQASLNNALLGRKYCLLHGKDIII